MYRYYKKLSNQIFWEETGPPEKEVGGGVVERLLPPPTPLPLRKKKFSDNVPFFWKALGGIDV